MSHVILAQGGEAKHLLVVGATGSGKSTLINELLHGAFRRADRAIIVDPNGHALERFGTSGDLVLNPFDTRSPGWSIFNELRKSYDYERLAKSLIPDSDEPTAQQWHGYAQQLAAETMRALSRNGDMTTERLLFWLTQAPNEDLKTLLAGSPMVGLFNEGADKALGSTKFIITTYISCHQYLRPGDFSLRNWLEAEKGNLFITWHEGMVDSLRPLVSAWADILIATILTSRTVNPQRLWLVLDELASLNQLNSLEAGLTKGRKHGLQIVAGVQAMSQLDSRYGIHNARSLRSCFSNLVALGGSTSDPHTARELSDGLGQFEVERTVTTISESDGKRSTSTTRQRSVEQALLPSELTGLQPLEGFLKFAGNAPIAKFTLVHREYPINTAAFSEFNT